LKTKNEREGFGSGNRRRTSSVSQNLSQSNDDDVASIKKNLQCILLRYIVMSLHQAMGSLELGLIEGFVFMLTHLNKRISCSSVCGSVVGFLVHLCAGMMWDFLSICVLQLCGFLVYSLKISPCSCCSF
jgi:hypothetical protein